MVMHFVPDGRLGQVACKTSFMASLVLPSLLRNSLSTLQQREKTRAIADNHANLAKTVEMSIVQHLQKLRAEIKAHIKNIQLDTGKLAVVSRWRIENLITYVSSVRGQGTRSLDQGYH
jgi:hypothetical protein